jgi:hypothetical protein
MNMSYSNLIDYMDWKDCPTGSDRKCPKCGSTNVAGYEDPTCERTGFDSCLTPETYFWFVPTVCNDCGMTWDEVLTVAGIAPTSDGLEKKP